MNRRSPLFWIVVAFGGLVGLFLLCVVGVVILGKLDPNPRSSTTSQGSVSAVPATETSVPAPAPTSVPRATVQAATPTPADLSDRYLAIAKAGVKLPLYRSGDLPAGEWSAYLLDLDEPSITMPLLVGSSNEQTVRLGKLAMAQVAKALFDEASELEKVNVIGTTPLGNSEAAAISIVVSREEYNAWDGTADNLGKWNVSQRLR